MRRGVQEERDRRGPVSLQDHSGGTRGAVLVGFIGLLVGVAYALRVLIPDGGDPTALLAFGEESPVQTAYAEERLEREVVLRPYLGHDGKFYFIQANDPLYLDPATHATAIDRPVYRAQRMLLPLLSGGFGLLPPEAVAWGLIAVNIAALGLGTAYTARYGILLGLSPWLGLAFALNLGLLAEFDITGSGIVGLAAGVSGAVQAKQGRWGSATLWFTGAVLAREVMVLFVAGVVLIEWIQTRRLRWAPLIVPTAAAGVWRGYLLLRIGHLPELVNQEVVSAPFSGLFAALAKWMEEPIDLVIGTLILLVMLAFLIRALPSRDPFAWGALGFVGLAPFLSVNVWAEWYDIARAVAPAFTAYVILLAKVSRDDVRSRSLPV